MVKKIKTHICEYCYQELISRGEPARGRWLYVDEEDAEESRCEWCEENGFDVLYEI